MGFPRHGDWVMLGSPLPSVLHRLLLDTCLLQLLGLQCNASRLLLSILARQAKHALRRCCGLYYRVKRRRLGKFRIRSDLLGR